MASALERLNICPYHILYVIGNNLFDDEITTCLKEVGQSEARSAYILFVLILYVLGNNLFDDEITACLKEVGQSEARSAYILMERVFPPVIRNYLVRVGDAVVQQDMVSELGVFGIFVG